MFPSDFFFFIDIFYKIIFISKEIVWISHVIMWSRFIMNRYCKNIMFNPFGPTGAISILWDQHMRLDGIISQCPRVRGVQNTRSSRREKYQ